MEKMTNNLLDTLKYARLWIMDIHFLMQVFIL
jgi:hypothetical protein